MFVREGLSEPLPIGSMPGVVQHTIDSLQGRCIRGCRGRRSAASCCSASRPSATRRGSAADDPHGILNLATRAVRAEAGDALVVQTDLCLDEFTDHGHCGVLSARRAASTTTRRSSATARWLALRPKPGRAARPRRGMMDGQVAVVRETLDAAGFTDTALLAYSAKYASAFYGPFREAVDSQLTGTASAIRWTQRTGARGCARRLIDQRGRGHRDGEARDELPRRALRRRRCERPCPCGHTRCRERLR